MVKGEDALIENLSAFVAFERQRHQRGQNPFRLYVHSVLFMRFLIADTELPRQQNTER